MCKPVLAVRGDSKWFLEEKKCGVFFYPVPSLCVKQIGRARLNQTETGLYKLLHPAIPDGRTWSKLGEHGEHGKRGEHGKCGKISTTLFMIQVTTL